MKKVEAIIRPERLDKVSAALLEGGYNAMTVTEVKGRGAQKGIALQFRGKEIVVDMIPKIKIEIVLGDDSVDDVVEIIRANARTGRNGDGKIFVYNIEECLGVRSD